MSVFHHLMQQLSLQLEQQGCGCPHQHKGLTGLTQLQSSVEMPAAPAQNATLLAWLKGQTRFPHYFWQSRDSDQTLTAVGAVRRFDTLDDVEQFSQHHPFCLVGGLEFDGKCHFILPRLLLVKNANKLTAYLTLDGETDGEERQHCLALLAEFAQSASLNADDKEHEQADNRPLASHSAYQFADWQANIERAISHIQQQAFNKVVLANAFRQTFEHPISPYDLLRKSPQTNVGCYHFLWAENEDEAFIGSSPERLYLRQARHFFTEALAGTVAVTDSLDETERNALWLLNDPKNIYENWLVVDDICTHLADCTHDIQVGDAEIKRLHNVQHLRRQIQTELQDKVSDADCLARIHPTAAVAGLPRPPAKQFIAEHEPFQRGWYAGTLGYFSPERAEFCVTLRSALVQRCHITLFAGAGIVEKSNPEAEWQEIERKSLAMARLLAQT